MQLNELLAILSKRRYGVIAVVLLTLAFSAALALVTPPRYEATATLALTPKIDLSKGFISATDLSALLSTYAETAKSRVTGSRKRPKLWRIPMARASNRAAPIRISRAWLPLGTVIRDIRGILTENARSAPMLPG